MHHIDAYYFINYLMQPPNSLCLVWASWISIYFWLTWRFSGFTLDSVCTQGSLIIGLEGPFEGPGIEPGWLHVK